MRDKAPVLLLIAFLLMVAGCTSDNAPAYVEAQQTVPLVTATESPLPAPTVIIWTRHVDPTGISYAIPPGWRVDDFDPSLWMKQPEGGSTPDQANGSTLLPPDADESSLYLNYDTMNVFTWSATHPVVEPHELVFPYRLGIDFSTGGAEESFDLNDAIRIMYFVAPNGVGWQSPPALANPCCGSLNAWVINLGCRMEITFATSFGAPGPVASLAETSLVNVVAHHFPVFDAMVRSVEFPPPCTDEAPVAPSEWRQVVDAFGIMYQVPEGYETLSSGKEVQGDREISHLDYRPSTLPPDVMSTILLIFTQRSIDSTKGPPHVRPKWGNVILPQVVDREHGITTTLAIYSDRPLLNETAGDAWSTTWVAAELSSERCAMTSLFYSTMSLNGIQVTEESNLAELVAEQAPILEQAYRSVRFPPECVTQ